MIGMIWAYDYESGVEKLKEIKTRYEFINIFPQREKITKHTTSWIQFSNGDVWRMTPPRESARGNKVNISYVDRRIDKEFFCDIIRPCTIAPPYNAFHYYGSPNAEKE